MTPDLDRIRTTHAVAIANRQRGSFDSRDDDIGVLLNLLDEIRDGMKLLESRFAALENLFDEVSDSESRLMIAIAEDDAVVLNEVKTRYARSRETQEILERVWTEMKKGTP